MRKEGKRREEMKKGEGERTTEREDTKKYVSIRNQHHSDGENILLLFK